MTVDSERLTVHSYKLNPQLVLVLDFGGQYKELIARRVRGFNVYSEVKSGLISAEEVRKLAPIGIILTGGPNSVYDEASPKCDPEIFRLGIPVLGICYGMQLICHTLGGQVSPCKVSEYGLIKTFPEGGSPLFSGVKQQISALMSHTDGVSEMPEGFTKTASTANCPTAAFECESKKLYGTQFHPETEHSEQGGLILQNFLQSICGAKGDYDLGDYLEHKIAEAREKVGSDRVLLALSGGVDSSVAASLLSLAVPGQLTCIFVDHGFMRMSEGDEIERVFSKRDLHFIRVNAEERFLNKIKGISDPERKRKLIGEEFARVFEEEALKLGEVKYLAQGTIYPDVIESGGIHASTIKSHHNVGGLPKNLSFTGLVEPLSGLFKDEVRKIGYRLGLPKNLIERQPFPGPGLAIRIMGSVTKQKLDILRHADLILRQELDKLKNRPQQYFAVFTNIRTVGVMGDGRTYDYVIALRAVNTSDFMTCEYARVPHAVLSKIALRIANEVKHVSRVVYDVTGKPPATIEWE
jgi:GMP synthase (glutamine-hydrolysing)